MSRVNRRRWSLPLGVLKVAWKRWVLGAAGMNGLNQMVIVGHAYTCLKYHCHRLRHAHTKAQGKYMTFVKRENCAVAKCFKTEYEFRQSMHGILFRDFSYGVVKRCCSVHWLPPKLGKIFRKRRRMNVICILDDFQACTSPRTWTDWRKFHMVGTRSHTERERSESRISASKLQEVSRERWLENTGRTARNQESREVKWVSVCMALTAREASSNYTVSQKNKTPHSWP